ncbi:MAG: OmpA family protein [Alphaproteobacteria bacterium]|jgi:outer membrane protein OmpA-like peptidoglycan-associated protein|nr:OmpA family protein [Alphaproteobacteria bacterium]
MLKNALLASALGLSIYALSAGANAGQRSTGWYVGAEGGANWIDNADVAFNTGFGNFEAEFESGWAVFAEVGYRWENNWRIELEAGWRENDVDCVDFGGGCFPGNFGDVSQFTQMINVIHDIPLSDTTAFSIGLGFGGNFVDVDVPALVDDDSFVLAGQALFQLSHKLTERLDFVMTYRYMTSDDPEFRVFGPLKVDYENENHTVSVGLRFDLQTDPAPVMEPVTTMEPPPPPPSEPKQFIVYFGFNKAALDKKAMEVIEEAAATAMRVGYVSILVTGHTDTIGSTAYNQRLSTQRAKAVSKALVGEGIPAKGITAVGKGETELMVQTGDREIEPRNRRATIDIE